MVLTCTDQNTFLQRWTIESDGVLLAEHTFTGQDQPGVSSVVNSYYNFTLVSRSFDHFESIFSTIINNDLENSMVTSECVGFGSPSTVTVTIEDSYTDKN